MQRQLLKSLSILLLGLSLLLPLRNAQAKTEQQCSLVSGTLIQLPGKPLFKFNKARNRTSLNYPQTHSQFFIQDGNGSIYKIILDNLFYLKLTNAQAAANHDVGLVADLNRHYPVGSSVTACGKVFKQRGIRGLKFVHPSACATSGFNGFLHIQGSDVSSNLKYCGGCACKYSLNR